MPTEQSYAIHRHNPVMTNVGFLSVLVAIVAFVLWWRDIAGPIAFGVGIGALIFSQMVLLGISRAYTVRLQDRIIKLEMRVRLAQLLSPASLATAARLSKGQIVALRFASDAELPALIERADRERLTPDQIKREIKNWVPDLDRT